MLAMAAPFSFSSCKLAFDEKQFMDNSPPLGTTLALCFTPPKQQVALQEGLLTFPQFGLLTCV